MIKQFVTGLISFVTQRSVLKGDLPGRPKTSDDKKKSDNPALEA